MPHELTGGGCRSPLLEYRPYAPFNRIVVILCITRRAPARTHLWGVFIRGGLESPCRCPACPGALAPTPHRLTSNRRHICVPVAVVGARPTYLSDRTIKIQDRSTMSICGAIAAARVSRSRLAAANAPRSMVSSGRPPPNTVSQGPNGGATGKTYVGPTNMLATI